MYLGDGQAYMGTNGKINMICRVDSRFAPSQWEMALLCNDISYWLGANLESALIWHSSMASQFHKTLNGENQSGSFRDMHSTISGLSFEKFWAHGQAHMGQMGKWPWLCTNTGLDNSIELWIEKICPVVSETSLPTPSDMTILHQLKGLRGKMICGQTVVFDYDHEMNSTCSIIMTKWTVIKLCKIFIVLNVTCEKNISENELQNIPSHLQYIGNMRMTHCI